MDKLKIKEGLVVALTYKLYEGNAQGKFIEEADASEPFLFFVGSGGVLPKFEEALLGKEEGDNFQISLPCNDAYGEVIEQYREVKVDKNAFGFADKEEEEAFLQLGHILSVADQDGDVYDGKITKLNKKDVIMDMNHELAGMDLFFDGKIVEVRQPTKEETDFDGEGVEIMPSK
ncbi:MULTISPECIES: FKBP-type peptidyl-prolyl cis-trans isomerase [Flammeovirga]|uniref:Peptidyl-prolyl cis-trans isomerase n=1 Tax=Flammeovirga agarivorans TaxID=2726742 RepID=A0A7X8XUD1_9BACT|nr:MULTISPECIES: FKBP-type peptidyl-prolyl cis-trans isomerase [Flammeovirga]NLR90243.1 peptidylprolyl isomerase [Flammeovirga agarivorans]